MWNFTVQHVVHIINRIPSPLLKFKSPFELLHKEPPSIIHLKVFCNTPFSQHKNFINQSE
ncbi:hypothetical protein MTR_6g061560 [Medicago truncatula]|uniref:Uncharacterized protein n=1 Tax=Medicago truncatula TaxID=3880 RepID=G7KNF1_MEDTR|nr:hypothetical protein MTR_6g061560 [Medicago truncatula]